MAKRSLPASGGNLWPMPVPTVIVSCAGPDGRANAITLGAAGVACARPPLLSAAISPQRYSHGLITEARDFVVNVPSARQAELVDRCGCVSGRNCDKFELLGLTALPAEVVRSPLIAECPVNYECALFKIVPCGSHDLFLGEIKRVHIDDDLLNPDGSALDPDKFNALLSLQAVYFGIGPRVDRWLFTRS